MKRIFPEKELMSRVKDQSEKKPFYRIDALNYTGKSSEGKFYTEVIAAWLAENTEKGMEFEILKKNADMIEKEKYQDGPLHAKGPQRYSAGSNRDEENIAKRLMEQDPLMIYNFPGTKVVDYQVPINRVQSSKQHPSQGKVDLILANECETIIGELKDADSNETMLRAMVEAKTYQLKITKYEFVKDRFIRSYGHESIQPAVLFFEGTQPWRDFQDMCAGERKELRSLAKKWDMLFFLVGTVQPMNTGRVQNNDFVLERLTL